MNSPGWIRTPHRKHFVAYSAVFCMTATADTSPGTHERIDRSPVRVMSVTPSDGGLTGGPTGRGLWFTMAPATFDDAHGTPAAGWVQAPRPVPSPEAA